MSVTLVMVWLWIWCILWHQLVLYQNQRLHSMLEGQFMFSHLGKDSAYIQVDVAGIANLQAVFNRLFTEMQIVVFNFESLLQVWQGWTEFLCSAEHTRKVVIRDCSVTVAFLSQGYCLVQQLQWDIKVLCILVTIVLLTLLEETHWENVTNYCSFTSRSHSLTS